MKMILSIFDKKSASPWEETRKWVRGLPEEKLLMLHFILPTLLQPVSYQGNIIDSDLNLKFKLKEKPTELLVDDEKTLWLLEAIGQKAHYFEDITIKNGKVCLTIRGTELLKYVHKLTAEKLTGKVPQPSTSEFMDTEAILKVDGVRIQLPPFKNEHLFCRSMFEYMINEPVDWDVLYEKIHEISPRDKNDWHRIYDTVKAINKRIEQIKASQLFVWQEKTVRRLR